MNIQQFVSECKSRLESRDVYIALVIILVGFGSFGLGRLSMIEESREPVQIEYTAVEAAVVGSVQSASAGLKDEKTAQDGAVVASKSGKVYHLPWCSGAQKISEKNKITFASKEEAEAKGYKPAANCKGL